MKRNTWKKAITFVMAFTLVAGTMPANVIGGGLFGDTAIVASAEGEVTISNLWIGDSGEITAAGVVNDTNGSGTATVSTEGDAIVVELNNFSYTGAGVQAGNSQVAIYYAGTAPLIIKLTGANTLTASDVTSGNSYGILSGKAAPVTINGGGSLTVTSGNANFNSSALSISGTLTISECKINATAGNAQTFNSRGISTDSGLTINNAEVEATAGTVSDGRSSNGISAYNNKIIFQSGKLTASGYTSALYYGSASYHTSLELANGSTFNSLKAGESAGAATDTELASISNQKYVECEATAAPTFSNASVTLADDLAMNFYVDGIADDTAAAEYSVKFEGECVDKTSALAYNAAVGKYYATTHVYAKDINQKITAQLYKGEDTVGAPIVTSVSEYLTALKTPLAAKLIADPTNPDALTADEKKLFAMVSAAQLFGDASAAYFNPTETINDTSVAAKITTYMTQANISDAALTAMVAQYAPAFDSDAAKLSLVLDSKTAARLYVKGDTTGTESTINATKADYPSYREVTGLLPQNLADEQKITVGGTDYKFSALTWCNRVLNNTNASQKNINMAKAIMAYYTAAKAYTAPANPYADKSIGDVVTFGGYDWYIINKSDNGVTLLMQNNLPNKKYNDSRANVTWATCSLRTYLNGDFYNSFSTDDKAKIVKTSNTNPNNGSVSGGNDTEDYIYLLSIAEANALDNSIRANGSLWWLRSPGSYSNYAAFVNGDGYVDKGGYFVDYDYGVRPALNLKF